MVVDVDKNLAEAAVGIFAGAKVDLKASDAGFLGVAGAPLRQAFPAVGLRMGPCVGDGGRSGGLPGPLVAGGLALPATRECCGRVSRAGSFHGFDDVAMFETGLSGRVDRCEG
jgi:hypothetical protein